MDIVMSRADKIHTQGRLHISHPEVQKHQINRIHAPPTYVVCSSHALARCCFVPEFPSPSRLISPHYMTQRGTQKIIWLLIVALLLQILSQYAIVVVMYYIFGAFSGCEWFTSYYSHFPDIQAKSPTNRLPVYHTKGVSTKKPCLFGREYLISPRIFQTAHSM